jgi:hypothetical protein
LYRFRALGTVALAGLLIGEEPALATSCDDRRIAAMSLEEAAQSIWEHSDVIGFAYVTTVDSPEREQQFMDMVVSLKGPEKVRLAYAPLRVGRVGAMGPGLYRHDAGPDGIMFLTMVRTERGFVVPACRELVLAKDRPGIIRRLIAMAKASG